MTLEHASRRSNRSRDFVPEDILVLCYHAVSEAWPAATSVTPANLEAQLSYFVARGCRGATMRDALTAPRDRRTLVVTFDDAHSSVLSLGFPILEKLGLPATVFVPTAYAGTDALMGWAGYDRWLGTEHERELACLSWDDLRGLAESGWEVGSHTHTHPRLPTLDDAALSGELRISRDRCEEEMGEPCRSLAYPYGDYDSRVAEAAREAGYALACTVPVRSAPALPLQWPRVIVDHSDTTRRVQLRAWRRSRRSVDQGLRRAERIARRLRP